MKGRLYRFTPSGGKPNHYTHDHSSAVRCGVPSRQLLTLDIREQLEADNGTWERIA